MITFKAYILRDSNQNFSDGLTNPLDIASVDAAIIQQILDWEDAGQTIQRLFTARVVADGAVMELPAGEAHMAISYEFSQQRAHTRAINSTRGDIYGEDYRTGARDVQSLFEEIQFPILSGVPGADRLDLSISARLDDYSDFGDNTSPHVGLSWVPVDWVAFHLNWGEFFAAPTVLDVIRANFTTLTYNENQANMVTPPAGTVIEPGRTDAMLLDGAVEGLLPQTADTWAVGFEISPPVVKGFTMSGNYYEIDSIDLIGAFNPASPTAPINYPGAFIFNPSEAQFLEIASMATNGENTIEGRDFNDVGVIVDFRARNSDEAAIRGFDLSFSYTVNTDIGTWDFVLSGNKKLESTLKNEGGAETDEFEVQTPEYTALAGIGWSNGSLRTKITAKHTDGFYVVNDAVAGEAKDDSFTTVDLFVGYEFQGSGFTDGLKLRINASNIFDEEPPLWRQDGTVPSYSGFTLGRTFTLGLTKTFQ